MNWLAIITILEWAIRIGMVPIIVRRRFTTPVALAWLSVIFAIPELGLLLYLLLGGYRLGRRRVRIYADRIHRLQARQAEALASNDPHAELPPSADPVERAMIAQAEHIGDMPILGGNDVELIGPIAEFADRLIADIDQATHHVHMLFYIYADDRTGSRVGDALCRAAARGVSCRLLVDSAGSWSFLKNDEYLAKLRGAGVDVRDCLSVNPLRRKLARVDVRNHRKLVVIDGRVGYTGSHNIVNADYNRSPRVGSWIDLTGRFTGPIVIQLQAVFLEDWAVETDQTLDGPEMFPELESTGTLHAQAVPSRPTEAAATLPRIQIAAISAAQHKVVISTPYLILDEPTLLALAMAVDRGCEVDIVVPAKSDLRLVDAASRAYYQRLMEIGVHVHMYHGGLLHSKTMTIDDHFALLGSSNLDIRSFLINFELNVILYGPEATRMLRQVQIEYLAGSTRLDLDIWMRKAWWRRTGHELAALLSPIL